MDKQKIFLFGVISPSTMHKIDEEFNYPNPNGYAEIKESIRTVSGETAGSAMVLSRLGADVTVAGNWLGERHGKFICDFLKQYGINTDRLIIKQGYKGNEEIVFTDHATRTVFGGYVKLLLTDKQWDDPSIDDIRNADIVSIDSYFRETGDKLARMCLEQQIPYVTIDCTPDRYICQNADALVVSEDYLNRQLHRTDYKVAFDEYLQNCRGLVICTFGAEEITYGRRSQEIKKFKPYKIKAVDTCGAGDSFRGAVVYGLAQGWQDERIVEFASAIAANICLRFPGCVNPPTLQEVETFMLQNQK